MNFRRLATLFVMLMVPLLLAFAGRVALAQEGKQGTAGAAPAADLSAEPVEVPAGELPAGSLISPQALDLSYEVEPNDVYTQANPINGDSAVVQAKIFPNADVDYFAFTAAAGDRVYAATMTSGSSNAAVDSTLQLLDSDGTTVLEEDLDDGSFGAQSSTIAGAELPSAGTYYLRVSHSFATGQLRPYHLHFRLQSGSPTAEVEPNDSIATAQPLPASGWIIGDLSSTADFDYYSLSLNAGDTIYVSLDLDPTRDDTQWNGQLGLAIFGGFILNINDASTGSLANPLSEAHFMTVKEAGTYYVRVNVPTGGTTFGDYTLSVTVHPAAAQSCTTYTSTDVPVVISDGAPSMVTSSLTVPGNPTIGDLNVFINLNHTFMGDLDVALYSPAGNTNALFNDIGNITDGGPSVMDLVLDDEAAIPPLFTVLEGMAFQLENNYDLDWFDGEDAGGEWTLVLWDDAIGDGGTLLGWGIEVCEPVEPPPMCAPGFVLSTVYSSDFESDDGGFTHSGTNDEWELGLPTADPISSCNSGSNCWKTDLAGGYDASSDQDLFSPAVDLSGYNDGVWVRWAQKYQMESASFDHAFVEVRETGGGNAQKLWEWSGATMSTPMGNPSVTLQESAGWGTHTADISSYQGSEIELRFHVDSDSTVQLSGLAVDDVSVLACVPATGDADIDVDPTSLSASLEPDQQDILTLDISNLGGADLTWNIVEQQVTAQASRDTRSLSVVDVIQDGGFEAGSPNPFWTEFSLNFGTTLCDEFFCGFGGGTGPHSGDWWNWFGGTTANEIGYTTQDVVIPAGTATLSFWLEIPAAGTTGFLNVEIDDNIIATYTEADAGSYATYTEVTLDVSAYADGNSHTVEFYSETFVGASATNFFVDDVVLEVDAGGGGCAANDIPWASVNPANGVTPGGATTSVDVTVDSTGLTPGVYNGELCIESNDPDEPEVFVPLTLTVDAPAGDPDIDVDPTSLSTALDPDQQDTLALDISNLGGADLTWNIVEQASSAATTTRRGAPAVNPGLDVSAPVGGATASLLDPSGVLYDQTDSASTASSTSQEFEAANEPFNNQAADDFVVPEADGAWTIDTIVALGAYFNGPGPMPFVNVYFYADNGGLPGAEVKAYDGLTSFTDAAGDLTIDLSADPVVLPAGTYWLSVQADMDFTPNGQWGWTDRLVQTGNAAAWRNPADGFGTGCTDWAARAAVCGVGVDPDHLFQLGGTIGGDVGCTANDIPWASVSPANGSTPGGSTTSVDVTFDATGLTPGVYSGELCIESNDPDEPEVIVPLTLTVEEVSADPDIDVDPTSLASTLPVDGQETQGLDISNLGGADLTWDVVEQEAAYTIALFEGNLIQDGGFEAGTPNPYWTEYSLNFGTTLCDEFSCGFGGGTGPHSGDWWNWFGGTTANEIGYTTQDVVIPAGTATLSFWLEIPVAGTTGFLNVEMDGDIIATYTEADAGSYATYAQVTLDVSAYADGNSHTVEFYSETFAGADVLNFFVDDVELTVVAGGVSCDAPSDLPWVSVNPTNGTTAPGGTSTVDVTFDATGLTPGVYSGNLCIASNDPDEPEVLVPLALTVEEDVEPPAPEILLVKTVGTNPAECADVDVINVPAGTEVTYCYEVTNTGEVTVNTHDLTDDQLGDLLTGYAYDLAPGASFYVTATATINADTTNTATWTAHAGDQQASAQDSATVMVIEEGPEEHLTFLPLAYNGAAEDQPVSQNTAKPAGFLSLLFSLPFFGLVLRRKA